MKTLPYFILFFITILKAQENDCEFPKDEKTGELTEIVNVDSISQNKLFVLINEWFASTYNDANSVIQMSDKEAGVIIGKGLITIPVSVSVDAKAIGVTSVSSQYNQNYTLKVDIKDNKYRYQLRPSTIYHSNSKLEQSFQLLESYCRLNPDDISYLRQYFKDSWASMNFRFKEKTFQKVINDFQPTAKQIIVGSKKQIALIIRSLKIYVIDNSKEEEW